MERHPHLTLVPHGGGSGGDIALTIDCDDCVGLGTSVCEDCMVTYLIGHEPGQRIELDHDEFRQLELLAHAGLVPESRFRSRHGVA